MTQRDYEAFAAIFAGDLATCGTDGERRKVRGIILSVADYMAQDNPAFKRDLFYSACGLTPETDTSAQAAKQRRANTLAAKANVSRRMAAQTRRRRS